MNMGKAAAAGTVGSVTTNVLHELTRHLVPNAPRVDLLGMQALAKGVDAAGGEPPKGQSLFSTTLAGDLMSNAGYFSLVGSMPKEHALTVGLILGVAAGLGAVFLPKPMGLATEPTSRSTATAVMTTVLYTAGGLAAGLTYRALGD